MAALTPKTKHVEVRLPPTASVKQERELGAFVRYCIQRIEKDLGERQQWRVEIDLGGRGYSALVEVLHLGLQCETKGYGHDGALAIWDAMCRIEQLLRERRGVMFSPRSKAANDYES